MSDETIKRAVAAALRAMRETSGMSQSEAARRLGTSHATVSRWEGGTRTPNVVDLANLAAVYDSGKSLAGLSDAITTARDLLGQKEE